MKTIYVDPKTFACHMDNAAGRIEVRTDVFDGMSDADIELYRFVPEGSKWVDDMTGETYTGQHVMPIDSGERALFQSLMSEAAANKAALEKNAADIVYISMMAGVNLDE